MNVPLTSSLLRLHVAAAIRGNGSRLCSSNCIHCFKQCPVASSLWVFRHFVVSCLSRLSLKWIWHSSDSIESTSNISFSVFAAKMGSYIFFNLMTSWEIKNFYWIFACFFGVKFRCFHKRFLIGALIEGIMEAQLQTDRLKQIIPAQFDRHLQSVGFSDRVKKPSIPFSMHLFAIFSQNHCLLLTFELSSRFEPPRLSVPAARLCSTRTWNLFLPTTESSLICLWFFLRPCDRAMATFAKSPSCRFASFQFGFVRGQLTKSATREFLSQRGAPVDVAAWLSNWQSVNARRVRIDCSNRGSLLRITGTWFGGRSRHGRGSLGIDKDSF